MDSLLSYRKCHWHFLPNLPSKALHGKFGVRFESTYHRKIPNRQKPVRYFWWKRVDYIAGALRLWSNVKTVHRTVFLSLLALLREAFAPITGSNPPIIEKELTSRCLLVLFGGRGWIRTTEVVDVRFTV